MLKAIMKHNDKERALDKLDFEIVNVELLRFVRRLLLRLLLINLASQGSQPLSR
jgi:hypothetical protein